MLKFFVNKKYALIKRAKRNFSAAINYRKNIITHFITHFIAHMVNSIKWNSNYNVVNINFNRFFVVFNSYLKIVQWFESVQFCNF